MKSNLKLIVGIVIGVIASCGIGYVVAENITASNITYTNNNQTTAEGALNDLYDKANAIPVECYNGVCGKLSYKYWNDNRSNKQYFKNRMPSGTGLNGTYNSREEFAAAYSEFENDPRYIRSVLIDGNVVGHEACLYYNNREFCFGPNYWVGTIETRDEAAGTATGIKFQRDMETALGAPVTSCYSSETGVFCYYGSLRCATDYRGAIDCRGADFCGIFKSGTAYCK